MFCRFGLEEDSLPVAATVWLNDVWSAPVLRIDQPRQRLEVGGVQLVQLAPRQERVDDRVGVAELLEDAGVGGELALRRLLPGLEPQLVVEDRSELRWRVEIELLPRLPEHLGLEGRHPVADRLPHLLEIGHVEPDAPCLHPRQDGGERQLHVLEEMPETLAVDLLLQDGREERHGGRLGGDAPPGILGEELTLGFLLLVPAEEVGAQVALRERRERIVRRAGIQQVPGQHRVERHALEEGAGSQRDPLEGLRVVRPFRGRGIGQPFADRAGAVERRVRGLRPTRRDPQADQHVGLLVDRDADGVTREQVRRAHPATPGAGRARSRRPWA